jgi:hypothetical protein
MDFRNGWRKSVRPVELSELKNIAEYELERPAWRPRVLALKERRRIDVGEHLTFLFENRETVRYQIQEMMRIERMVKTEDIAHEVATYNELVPKPGELSATLLIAYPSEEERDVMLRKLLGLENSRLGGGRGRRPERGAVRHAADRHRPHQLRAVCEIPADGGTGPPLERRG